MILLSFYRISLCTTNQLRGTHLAAKQPYIYICMCVELCERHNGVSFAAYTWMVQMHIYIYISSDRKKRQILALAVRWSAIKLVALNVQVLGAVWRALCAQWSMISAYSWHMHTHTHTHNKFVDCTYAFEDLQTTTTTTTTPTPHMMINTHIIIDAFLYNYINSYSTRWCRRRNSHNTVCDWFISKTIIYIQLKISGFERCLVLFLLLFILYL